MYIYIYIFFLSQVGYIRTAGMVAARRGGGEWEIRTEQRVTKTTRIRHQRMMEIFLHTMLVAAEETALL